MDNQLVSIITPMYNGEKYVSQTIESVLAQTYQNWEMIIVDDGSKDASSQIVKKYSIEDNRIKLVHQQNAGSAAARNNALRRANGRYICFLDADDLLDNSFLEKQLEYLKTEKRAEVAERIKVALGFGDLSENSEYDEAKSAQAENESKIIELENKLRHAKIIDESEIDTKTVQVGNTVKLLDIEFDEQVSYTIVGSTEVDLAQNRISNESPIGTALLGAKKNQVVEVQAPAGVIKYKVLAITK